MQNDIMSIKDYIEIIEDARNIVNKTSECSFRKTEIFNKAFEENSQVSQEADGENMFRNKIYHANNIVLLKKLANCPEYRNRFSLIYIDPPFFTRTNYHATLSLGEENVKHLAYEDKWKSGKKDYLIQLASGLLLMKEVLSDEGLIWLHLDWHIVHYAKILMDEIFGEKNFVNEVIWTYKSGGSSNRRFSRKHDNLLVYSKTSKYKFNPLKEKSYNRQFKPYRFKGVEEFEDGQGWYTMVNMKDVWNIDMVGRTSKERTGYATQKPELLLERIIESSTSEGDLCGDFFSGSGTLAAACENLGRKYIVCDESNLAVESCIERMAKRKGFFEVRRASEFRKTSDAIDGDERAKDGVRNSDTYKPCGKVQIAKRNLTEYELAVSANTDLKYWSVGFIDDEGVFNSHKTFFREKNKLKQLCIVDKDFFYDRDVVVKTVDVFGNRKYIEVEVK